jgi:peroxisomal 3,2-trans-enoyl-CoA isomerase
MSSEIITVEYRGNLAIITIANEKKLNALDRGQYDRLASLLREIAKRDDICITLLTAKGRFFSA